MALRAIKDFPKATPSTEDLILIEQQGGGRSVSLKELPVSTPVEKKISDVQKDLNARITALAFEPGDTTGDAELRDIRNPATGFTVPAETNAGGAVRAQVTQLDEKISNLKGDLVNVSNGLMLNKYTCNEEIEESVTTNANNRIAYYENWFTSEYIDVSNCKNVICENIAYYYNVKLIIPPISFFTDTDANTFISIEYDISSGSVFNGTFNVPSNAKYMRVTIQNNGSTIHTNNSVSFTSFIHDNVPMENSVKAIQSGYVFELEKDIKLIKDLNILCCGDSLTEGDYGSTDGQKNVQTENYPYFMQKYLGCNVVNAGKCGYTPVDYADYEIQKHDLTNIDIVLIMLGTNGTIDPHHEEHERGMTDTIEESAPRGTGQYQNNDTGKYCKLIDYILEQNPTIQIILVTPPIASSSKSDKRSNSEKASVVVPKIALRYGLPCIDAHNESGWSDFTVTTMQPIDGLHGGKIGYQRLGTYIGSRVKSYMSWLIE